MIDNLDTSKGCDAHKAVTACIGAIKQKQKERDTHIEDMHKDINSRVSTRLFYFAMAVLIAFLSFNAIQNTALMTKVAVAQVMIEQVAKSQGELKTMVESITR
jgi:hypothetical protein